MARLSILIGYKAASEVTAKLSMFAIVVVAARRLEPEAFGLFALAATFGWLLGVVSDLGLQLHVAREVAREPGSAAQIVVQAARLRATLAALAALAAVPVATALGGSERWPFWTLVASYLVSSLVEFLNHAYRGLMRSDLESSLNLVQRAATLGLAVLMLPWRPSLASLATAFAVPAVATLAGSLAVAWRLGVLGPGPAGTRTHLVVRRLAGEAAPIGAGLVLSALYWRIDLFLVERWVGIEAAAGYNAAFRLVEALRLMPAAVLAVVFPLFCRTRSLRPAAVVASALLGGGLVVAGLAWIASPWLVHLFYGDRYLPAVPVLRVLVVAVPLCFSNYALTHQVLGWDAQRRYAVVCAAALAANVAVNAALLPVVGAVGAAWATVVTELVVTAGCLTSLVRLEAPRPVAARVPARVVT